MDDIIHDQLNQLRIIGQIRIGQKITTTNGISVYNNGIITWLSRMWNRDGKFETIRVLKDLYKSVDLSITEYIKETDHMPYDEKIFKKRIYLLIKMAESLHDSIGGIENLSQTYSDNQTVNAGMDSIVKDYIIIIYGTLLDYIDRSLWSDKLKTIVTYNGNILYRSAPPPNKSSDAISIPYEHRSISAQSSPVTYAHGTPRPGYNINFTETQSEPLEPNHQNQPSHQNQPKQPNPLTRTASQPATQTNQQPNKNKPEKKK